MNETRLILEDSTGRPLDEFILGQRPLTIGRGRRCGVRLPSPFVSKRHARIQPLEGDTAGWALSPLGLNGTRVNRRLVREGEEHTLAAGDEIEIPGFRLRVLDPGAHSQDDRYRLAMNRRYSQLTAALHEQLLDRVDLRTLTAENLPEGERRQRIQTTLQQLLDQGAEVGEELEEFILQESVRQALVDRLFNPEETRDTWRQSTGERAFLELVTACTRRLGLNDRQAPLKERVWAISEGFRDAFEELRSTLSIAQRTFAIRRALRKDLENLIFHLGPLEDLLRLPDLNEIMVIGNHRIFIETQGDLQETGRTFPREDDLEVVIGRIVNPVGRFVNRSHPIVDARLADGSRVHIVIPPVSIRGPAITIRKFRKGPLHLRRIGRTGHPRLARSEISARRGGGAEEHHHLRGHLVGQNHPAQLPQQPNPSGGATRGHRRRGGAAIAPTTPTRWCSRPSGPTSKGRGR